MAISMKQVEAASPMQIPAKEELKEANKEMTSNNLFEMIINKNRCSIFGNDSFSASKQQDQGIIEKGVNNVKELWQKIKKDKRDRSNRKT